MTRKLFLLVAALLFAGFSHADPTPVFNPLEKQAKVEVLSSAPRIYYIYDFLSEEECDHMIELARPHLRRSLIVDEASEMQKVDSARTSQGMFFSQYPRDSILQEIEQRITALTLIPPQNGEGIQVLLYQEAGEYKPHYDYFDPNTVGGAACYKRGGQRVATLIMYLNTVEKGGETIFPAAKIKVKAKKGNAVLFYNCILSGKEDPLTLHGGAPVIKGEKWIATKWLHERSFR